METVSFVHMDQGTAEEYAFLGSLWDAHKNAHLVDNVLGLLKALEGPTLGYKIDRYQHSLQSATTSTFAPSAFASARDWDVPGTRSMSP